MTQVPILSLDRVLGATLHGKNPLILVDIEGAEFMVLQGTTNLDERTSPNLDDGNIKHRPLTRRDDNETPLCQNF